MPPPTQFQIKENTDQERAVIHYTQRAQEMLLNQYSIRYMLEEADRLYMREKDWTDAEWKARLANRGGDTDKMRNITVPVIMPQVRSALGYMTNVFLTGYPIFGVASSPQFEDAAMMMESIIAENQETAQWARELMMFFNDGLKYNIHAVECEWQSRTVYNVQSDVTSPSGAGLKKVIWKGNVLKRLDLYNSFWDPRVQPSDICRKAEFAGYNDVFTRVQFMDMVQSLQAIGNISQGTIDRCIASSPAQGVTSAGVGPYAYYTPMINPFPATYQNRSRAFDWMSWAMNVPFMRQGITNYANAYVITKIYARIIPYTMNFNVPEAQIPQVWKFIIVNGAVVLYAERQSNAHNFLPIFFGQPLEDGLMYQTKSFAYDVEDMQAVASAFWNGFIASKRRLVGDRVIYDPLRIRKEDINSSNPSAKIPVRPGAYGKPVAESVYQFPYHDENASSFIQAADLITRYANLINGQNPAQQGQFVKGNKTKHEYEDIMGHGNVTNQMMAIMTENQVFTPLKQAIKLNIMQFQDDSTVFNKTTQQDVEVKMDVIRQVGINFKVSDGIIPEDKMMSEDEFANALQAIASSPQIGQNYNLGPLFSYIMKTRGADLTPFEKPPEQIQYEQQMQAWQQAAAMAAQKGTAFNTPMPQPPPPSQQSNTPGNQTNGIAAPPRPAFPAAGNSNALMNAPPAGTGD
jgi:hypothetical protein